MTCYSPLATPGLSEVIAIVIDMLNDATDSPAAPTAAGLSPSFLRRAKAKYNATPELATMTPAALAELTPAQLANLTPAALMASPMLTFADMGDVTFDDLRAVDDMMLSAFIRVMGVLVQRSASLSRLFAAAWRFRQFYKALDSLRATAAVAGVPSTAGPPGPPQVAGDMLARILLIAPAAPPRAATVAPI